jgi:hypothetical protein
MMTASECRARSLAALETAAKTADPMMKRHWQITAKDWVTLAVQVEAQEAMSRWVGRTSDEPANDSGEAMDGLS